jgi:O-acetyl-ADP-ribose deacetylase (regulator of RNase III)
VLLASCYRTSLALALKHDCKSIAFPAISTGVYRYPLEAATEIAVQTVREILTSVAAIDVHFACFDARTLAVYQRALGA